MGIAWGELFIAMRDILTEDQVREIHALCGECRLTDPEIGAMYGVSDAAVHKIKKGKNWQHLGLKPWVGLPNWKTWNMKSIRQRILESSTLNLVSGCWEWDKTIGRGGYGKIQINKAQVTASRASYEEFIGPIPDGMLVCHKCDNRRCCNPEHLFLGTHQDNADDMLSKSRSMHGSWHYKATIDESQAVAVFEMIKSGATNSEIQGELGVGKNVIQSIKAGFSWNHVTGLPKKYLKRNKSLSQK